ncbi:hypothetical protein DPMN_180226 [Dreissena polymorpha]|uniref:Uncharacterized protein n=1 Tax=Dreissena polymorpha TaxID=45954 RepID=A0A9D4EIL8_DREPO|nr:hypothetical protein DPMN_174722 [Dreissena polymorpha]KAH3778755.1 hypothetical protein DPMN_180226 [Dreissena polymorpha]
MGPVRAVLLKTRQRICADGKWQTDRQTDRQIRQEIAKYSTLRPTSGKRLILAENASGWPYDRR